MVEKSAAGTFFAWCRDVKCSFTIVVGSATSEEIPAMWDKAVMEATKQKELTKGK